MKDVTHVEASSLAVAEAKTLLSEHDQITAHDRQTDALDGLLFPNTVDSRSLGIKPSYQAPYSERTFWLVVGDTVAALFAAFAAYYLWHLIAHQTLVGSNTVVMAKLYWFPPIILLWMGLAWLFDMYDPTPSGNYADLLQQVVAVGLSSVAVGVTVYFFFPSYSPRLFILLFLPIMATLVVSWRGGYAAITNKLGRVHRVMVLGERNAVGELQSAFSRVRFPKYELVTWAEESDLSKYYFDSEPHALHDFARRANICEIVVCSSAGFLNNEALRDLVLCHGVGIRITSMPEVYRKLCRQIPVKHIGHDWMVEMLVDHPLFTRAQLGIKRLIDLCGSVLALPVLLLLAPFVAAAIRLESKGPVFYFQTRSGRCGRPFRIIKFRTMRTDAESDGVARWAVKNDSRITWTGHFLRKTRIDELPQIFNVLKGDMSLVGPRPERPELELTLERRLPHYAIRQAVKPGVTGWAQIHYRYGNSVEDSLRKLQYDLYYIRCWSLQLDLYIVFRTLGVVFRLKGQ